MSSKTLAKLLLQFMEIVEQARSAFAFSTQTLHVVNGAQPQDAGPIAWEASD